LQRELEGSGKKPEPFCLSAACAGLVAAEAGNVTLEGPDVARHGHT